MATCILGQDAEVVFHRLMTVDIFSGGVKTCIWEGLRGGNHATRTEGGKGRDLNEFCGANG